MSKNRNKSHNLPPLQKRIIISLAEKGPQTRNQVQKDVGSAYKNILYSFRSLEKKGLIQKMGVRHHRGREFPRFWLTVESALLSFFEGAPPTQLLNHAKECFSKEDSQIIQLAMEMPEMFGLSKEIGTGIIEQVYLISKKKENLEPMEIAILTAQLLLERRAIPTKERLRTGMDSLRQKYPKFYEKLRAVLKDMLGRAQELDEMLSHE